MQQSSKTDWDRAAEWYHEYLEGEGSTYQRDLILPNLLRLLDPKPGQTILDLGCGQGFFARAFAERGAKVIGVDSSRKLIEIAKCAQGNVFFSAQNSSRRLGRRDSNSCARKIHSPSLPQRGQNEPWEKSIDYHVASVQQMPFLKDKSIDTAVIVLAIQNMDQMHLVFKECTRVLKPTGSLALVLNHPAFRIPAQSSWGWDPSADSVKGLKGVQYRRVDSYLSESKIKIQTHPGDAPSEFTWTFHRPLQAYVKSLANAGFGVTRLEEWASHKKSQKGPRGQEEDRMRMEIPLFLYLQAKKTVG